MIHNLSTTLCAPPPPGQVQAGAQFGLSAPRPNPTTGATLIPFALAEAGPARLVVYDALGREVAVLADGEHAAGPHAAHLNGGALAPGVYVIRLTADVGAETTRLAVVR